MPHGESRFIPGFYLRQNSTPWGSGIMPRCSKNVCVHENMVAEFLLKANNFSEFPK